MTWGEVCAALERNSTCWPVERFALNLSQENMPTSRCAAFGSFPQSCLRWGLRPQTPDFMPCRSRFWWGTARGGLGGELET
jgi:hypothetical protein